MLQTQPASSKPDLFRSNSTGFGIGNTNVYCWGSTHHGQLGLGGIEEEFVSEPRELKVKVLNADNISDVGCGLQHTMFVMDDGSILGCGNNDYGQLGTECQRRKPTPITSLENYMITKVACGSFHNIALSADGQVLSWGRNSEGQLGTGCVSASSCNSISDDTMSGAECNDSTSHRWRPKLVKAIALHCVVQVACGRNHSMALTDTGLLFAWGDNSWGQLGIGQPLSSRPLPEQVASVAGVPLGQIAAGGDHSLTLTISGALFAWGRNDFGQLGLGDLVARQYPTLCRPLRSQRIAFVCCGEFHTAALTKDGGLFTFGAGSAGQLGHNSLDDQLVPRKNLELMGSEVIQVACGQRHTMVLVKNSGNLYAFGLNGCGQLGSGLVPLASNPMLVKGPWSANDAATTGPLRCRVLRLFTGGNHCMACVLDQRLPAVFNGHGAYATFALQSTSTIPIIDLRCPDNKVCPRILHLTADIVDNMVSEQADGRLPAAQLDKLEKILGSAGCMNASFLLPQWKHMHCGSRNHGVDLAGVCRAFELFAGGRWRSGTSTPDNALGEIMQQQLCVSLVPSLPQSPPDVEALRVFLIVPFSHLFHARLCLPLAADFCRKVFCMDKGASRVYNGWLSIIDVPFFDRLIQIFKNVATVILRDKLPPIESERQQAIKFTLEMLGRLSTVNEEQGQPVTYTQFYIADLCQLVDVRNDYIHWLERQHGRARGADWPVLLCDYPFIFDGPCKTLILQTDALVQMQISVDQANLRNMSNLFQFFVNPELPVLFLSVSRQQIVADTLNQLHKYPSHDLKKPLQVHFVGEDAVDQGGVRKEFFLLIMKEIIDPKYGMFRYFEKSRLLWFASQTFEEAEMFELIGKLCGLAIYNSTIVELPFPVALYKKLLRRPVGLDDFKELDPTVGTSLQHLIDYDQQDVPDAFGLTFSINVETFGHVHLVDLMPNGHNVPVDHSNKADYVRAYVDYTLNTAVGEQFDAFSRGFLMVCGSRVLELFQPKELQSMVVGNEDYDWLELQRSTDYKGEYSAEHPTVQLFWDVFHNELTVAQKRQFLKFLTGSDKIPILGMRAVRLTIQPTKAGEHFLPVAHTCFNLLDLPMYTSRATLLRKLLIAIQHDQGFGLA